MTIRVAIADACEGAASPSSAPGWRLTDRHRKVLLKVPDEGSIEGARLDGRCLDVLLRRGWIQRVHVDPRGRRKLDLYRRTPAARAALFPSGPPDT